jgi:hypothetical protein
LNPEKEKKQEQILLSLKRLDYLNRSQIQRMHNLGSVRNANRFLKSMDQYLAHFRDTENIYYLNKEGRARIDCQRVRKKTTNARHFLMRNDLYIELGRPSTWKNECKLSIPDTDISLICDAYYTIRNKTYIVEVDNTQKMTKNKHKVKEYRKLSEVTDFTLIWVTTTEYRKKRLEAISEGLKAKVYLWGDLK